MAERKFYCGRYTDTLFWVSTVTAIVTGVAALSFAKAAKYLLNLF